MICVVIAISACNKEEKIIKAAHEAYQSRRDAYIQNKLNSCQRALMLQAESIADTTLIKIINALKTDSIYIPRDTTKPIQPNISFPNYKKPTKPDTVIKI